MVNFNENILEDNTLLSINNRGFAYVMPYLKQLKPLMVNCCFGKIIILDLWRLCELCAWRFL